MLFNGFASTTGTLEQFGRSMTESAVHVAERGDSQPLIIGRNGSAEGTDDPLWLMREDVAQGSDGKRGLTYWEPRWTPNDRSTGGRPTTLVTEAFDLKTRAGIQTRTSGKIDRRNPYIRTVRGPSTIHDLTLPPVARPRYAHWDLSRFVGYAEHEFARHAADALPRAKYRDIRPYSEVGEFAGFAYIDQRRTVRQSGARTGAHWFGQELSATWVPGEAAAKEQLFRSAEDQSKRSGRDLAFAAVWWSEGGVVEVRIVETDAGHAVAGRWRIQPEGGAYGLLFRAMQVGNNTVTRLAENSWTTYTI